MLRMSPKRRAVSRNAHLNIRPTMDAVTPIIQQHNQKAIEASGFPVLIYRRVSSGIPCSCSKSSSDASSELYDESGDATPTTIQSILHQANFEIEEYGPEGNVVNTATEVTSDPVFDQGQGTQVIPEEPNSVFALAGYTANSCGICFGSGYVGGYQMLGCHRHVFTYHNIADSSGVEVVRDNYPHSLRFLNLDAYVSFRLPSRGLASYNGVVPNTLPSLVSIWNNNSRLDTDGYTPNLLIGTGPSAFRLRTYGSRLPAESTLITVSARDFNLMEGEILDFTHLEVVSRYGVPTFCDIPNLPLNYDSSKATKYTDTTIELPASVPLLSPFDVIADGVNQQLWMVNMAKPVSPSSQSMWHQSVDVSPVEPHWLQARLPIPDAKWMGASAPNVTPVPSSQSSYTRRGAF